jgi:hypothetical protein
MYGLEIAFNEASLMPSTPLIALNCLHVRAGIAVFLALNGHELPKTASP